MTNENFKIKISGSATMSRNGHDKNRGNYSDNRTLGGNVTVEVEEPQDLAKNLAEIWSTVVSNYLSNHNDRKA